MENLDYHPLTINNVLLSLSISQQTPVALDMYLHINWLEDLNNNLEVFRKYDNVVLLVEDPALMPIWREDGQIGPESIYPFLALGRERFIRSKDHLDYTFSGLELDRGYAKHTMNITVGTVKRPANPDISISRVDELKLSKTLYANYKTKEFTTSHEKTCLIFDNTRSDKSLLENDHGLGILINDWNLSCICEEKNTILLQPGRNNLYDFSQLRSALVNNEQDYFASLKTLRNNTLQKDVFDIYYYGFGEKEYEMNDHVSPYCKIELDNYMFSMIGLVLSALPDSGESEKQLIPLEETVSSPEEQIMQTDADSDIYLVEPV